jgi:hypothetical protein
MNHVPPDAPLPWVPPVVQQLGDLAELTRGAISDSCLFPETPDFCEPF